MADDVSPIAIEGMVTFLGDGCCTCMNLKRAGADRLPLWPTASDFRHEADAGEGYQTTCTGYLGNSPSGVRIVSPSTMAWQIMSRSKGSTW